MQYIVELTTKYRICAESSGDATRTCCIVAAGASDQAGLRSEKPTVQGVEVTPLISIVKSCKEVKQ
jgi:hypothetical protein